MEDEPVRIKYKRGLTEQEEELFNQLQKLLDARVIRRSNSLFCSPCRIVPKKPGPDGEKIFRLVIDYRKLNAKTIKDASMLSLQGVEMYVFSRQYRDLCKYPRITQKKIYKVFDRLSDAGLCLQIDKCQFLTPEITYFGHIIDCYGRCCIEDFVDKARPLNSLLQKNKKWEWTPKVKKSFKVLKQALCEVPVLVSVDMEKPLLLTTDASDGALGAVLSQGKPGENHPIAYMSRSLNKAEKNYSTTEKECLAMVEAIDYFRHYLYGRHFTVYGDHEPLTWMDSLKDPLGRIEVETSQTIRKKTDKKKNEPKPNSRKDAPPIPAGMEVGQANLDKSTIAKRLKQRRKDTVKTVAFSDPEATEFSSASEQQTTDVTLTKENNYVSSNAPPIPLRKRSILPSLIRNDLKSDSNINLEEALNSGKSLGESEVKEVLQDNPIRNAKSALPVQTKSTKSILKTPMKDSSSSSSEGELMNPQLHSTMRRSVQGQKDSEEESEEETFVFQNLSEKLIEENERLEQADNMDSQKPVDDGARSVSMPDNRPAKTDTNKQCPATAPLLVPSSTVREWMMEHAQKYASPIRAKSPLKNTNAWSTAWHGELTEVPSWKNLSTIEQEKSEEESEKETFVHQNLPEK
ncbi:hypothetical protein TSAR_007830 [Trichomalopsis sarcophagae]|uniref:Reverse transcriptase/retrotransposon-derived protein RNase H-like domain-containing protein n=1 Tax=Trichomalopsis sarcophagae TaxID=543379 RepID=A0A232EDV3_9HYME|nr:hypothetical protein TSAR_007830 [Trichomalopsis sarcophagae]